MIKFIRAAARRTIKLLVIVVLTIALAAVSFMFGASITDSVLNKRAPRMIPLVWVI